MPVRIGETEYLTIDDVVEQGLVIRSGGKRKPNGRNRTNSLQRRRVNQFLIEGRLKGTRVPGGWLMRREDVEAFNQITRKVGAPPLSERTHEG